MVAAEWNPLEAECAHPDPFRARAVQPLAVAIDDRAG
jgi:hypothetical protein